MLTVFFVLVVFLFFFVFSVSWLFFFFFFFFFQAEDGIRDWSVTGVQTCALPIWHRPTVWKRWGVAHAVNAGSNMQALVNLAGLRLMQVGVPAVRVVAALDRSEERRVGKEWRSGGWAEH